MPQPFKNAVMTRVGALLLTRAQAGEAKIEFTRIAVGNGQYTEEEKTFSALQEMTGLKSLKNSYGLSGVSVYSEQSVKITALITNQDAATGERLVNEGYFINEMGLFAKEKGGDTEVLYSIAVTEAENGDFMPPYNGFCAAQIIQEYYATVSNSAEVTIQTSGAFVLAQDFDEYKKRSEERLASIESQLQWIMNILRSYAYYADTETISCISPHSYSDETLAFPNGMAYMDGETVVLASGAEDWKTMIPESVGLSDNEV